MSLIILKVIMALCAEDKTCLHQVIELDPKSVIEASRFTRAVKARNERLRNRGYNECGPNISCFESFTRVEKANFLYDCEMKDKKDCWSEWLKSKSYKKLLKKHEKENNK